MAIGRLEAGEIPRDCPRLVLSPCDLPPTIYSMVISPLRFNYNQRIFSENVTPGMNLIQSPLWYCSSIQFHGLAGSAKSPVSANRPKILRTSSGVISTHAIPPLRRPENPALKCTDKIIPGSPRDPHPQIFHRVQFALNPCYIIQIRNHPHAWRYWSACRTLKVL